MNKNLITYKSGHLKLRKSTKEKIEKKRKDLGVAKTPKSEQEYSEEEQQAIVLGWRNYIYTNTKFDYTKFDIDFPILNMTSNRLFGTILEHRDSELVKEIFAYKNQRTLLSKIKKQIENKINQIFNEIIEEAILNNYSDEILLACLNYLDAVIELVNNETSPILKKYDAKIFSCNLEREEIKKLNAEGKFQKFVSNTEYKKIKEESLNAQI